jgi:hypothetical protein
MLAVGAGLSKIAETSGRGMLMKPIVGGLLLATLLASIPAAQAQIRACPASVAETQSFSIDGKSEDYYAGLAVSFVLGLTPSAFPFYRINDPDQTCARGEFQADGQTFQAFDNEMGSPPRWARGPDSRRVVYLAIMPPAALALAWSRSPDKSNGLAFKDPPLYVLAVTNGDKRDIFGVFEKLPGDAQLMSVFRDTLEGKLPLVATFNVETRVTKFIAH